MNDDDKETIRAFERDETFIILRWMVISIAVLFWLLVFGVSLLSAVKVCFIILAAELCVLELWKISNQKN